MEFRIKEAGSKALVFTPYHPGFVRKIKLITGVWDAGAQAWIVDASAIDAARAAMRKVYGRDDQSVGETVRVRLTFGEECGVCRGAVTMLGRVLSRAYGRDSGAKPGEGVLYYEGGPTSGGSVKNWDSLIKKGSVIELPNVPKALVDKFTPPDDVEIEILPETYLDVEALRAERARCEARITEINALLEGQQNTPSQTEASGGKE